MWCWGSNEDDRLGQINTGRIYPSPVQVGTWTDWSSVIVGGNFSCGLRAGIAWCWGNDNVGQLGYDPMSGTYYSSDPVQLSTSTWTQLSAGGGHLCGLRAPGTLWCWGFNGQGQLGDGTMMDHSAPTQVGTASDWTSISAEQYITCGVHGGAVYCWGYQYPMVPTQVGTGTNWLSVGAGASLTCGVQSDHSLWCWNSGDPTPRRVAQTQSFNQYIASDDHSCALTTGGALWCWGSNPDGRVGDGTKFDRLQPTPIAGAGTGWKSPSAGNGDTCALQSDGSLWCWGSNAFGQLGDGVDLRTRPTAVVP
jgi:alpha-tubulin suppressor-like RCC1 family protein